MKFDKNSVVHNITLMYVTFAHQTDGDFHPNEVVAVAGHSLGWMKAMNMDLTGDGIVDSEDVEKLLFEIVIPYYNQLSHQTILSEYVRIAHALKSLEWWNDDMSKSFLADLKQIAVVDGILREKELGFIDATAKIFGIEGPA